MWGGGGVAIKPNDPGRAAENGKDQAKDNASIAIILISLFQASFPGRGGGGCLS